MLDGAPAELGMFRISGHGVDIPAILEVSRSLFSLDQAVDAMNAMAERRVTGKVVLLP